MTLTNKKKLVEMYGEYKSEQITPEYLEIFNSVVSTLSKKMQTIVNPGDAIDFIDNLVDLCYWSCSYDDINHKLKEFLEFYR